MAQYDATTKDKQCIFCTIISKKDPDTIFWQDEQHVAFLSIDPNTPGFSLVVPKTHRGSDIMKMEDGPLQDFILAAKKVSAILEHFYKDVGRIGLIMEGTGIDHAHIKLIPMHGTEHLKRGEWRQTLSGVEHWFDVYKGWISSAGGPMGDPAELKKLSQELKKSIGS